MNIFEKATKTKLMVITTRGTLTVNDLWDLSLEELDRLYSENMKKSKSSKEFSLLNKESVGDKTDLTVEIIKHIVEVKLKEAEEFRIRRENKAKIREIEAILANKQLSELGNKSVEDLQKMIKELDN
jgi:hypothetical protein